MRTWIALPFVLFLIGCGDPGDHCLDFHAQLNPDFESLNLIRQETIGNSIHVRATGQASGGPVQQDLYCCLIDGELDELRTRDFLSNQRDFGELANCSP